MINEGIAKLQKVVMDPRTPVSVSYYAGGKTYSFPAFIEVVKTNGFLHILDIYNIYEVADEDAENYDRFRYTRVVFDCSYGFTLGTPSAFCSLRFEDINMPFDSTSFPLGRRPTEAHQRLVASLLTQCTRKVISQEAMADRYAIMNAIMSSNNHLQYN